jgi:CBS domain containing-hemolysin-like protein
VLKVLGFGGKAPPPIGEEEIKVLMEQGAKAGVFEKHEPLIVSRLFRLGELRVTGVMTPWPGDGFAWQGYRIEVVDMDVNRVDKVLVTRLAAVAT